MEHLPYIVTFAHVVQAGSFTAGAERLSLAPSVASKHVAKLEKKLGARLLNRTTRKLSLTDAGAAYFEHAARILEEIGQSEQAVQRLQAEPVGHLKVSTLNSFANAVLAPLLPDFLRRYPKLHLEIVCSERFVDLADEGFDLALRITRTPAPNLVARRIAAIGFQVCASPRYLGLHGVPATPAELATHRCLGYPASITPGSTWRFLHQGKEVSAPVRSVFEINSVETLRALALAGEGLALLPTYAIGDDLRDGRLTTVLPDYRGFSESVLYAVHLPNRYASPKLRAFVDYLLARIGNEPPTRPPAVSAARTSPRRPGRNSRRAARRS